MENWLQTNTFHHSQYADYGVLTELKRRAGASISVCIPTYNEAGSIFRTVSVLREALLEKSGVVDELVVVDSGSSDETVELAAAAGAQVHAASQILPEFGHRVGKGENLWKALHVLRGDVICYVDADIDNIHPRFVTGLIGPLLERAELLYVKAFYDRPLAVRGKVYPTGGGRVTEILVRPLFSMFYPELCALVQPLSGEYAGRRALLERLQFPSGYGVETAHLIDIQRTHGMAALAQTDLDVRVHRNRSNVELGRTAFAILQGFFKRLPGEKRDSSECFRFFVERASGGGLCLEEESRLEEERPPMIDVSAYRQRRVSE